MNRVLSRSGGKAGLPRRLRAALCAAFVMGAVLLPGAALADGSLTDHPNARPQFTVDARYYRIVIDKHTQVISVMRRDAAGRYTVVDRQFLCSTGKTPGRTPVGTFKIYGARYRWRASLPKYHQFMQYACRINGNILIHSVTYFKKNARKMDRSSYLNLGKPVSAGCIRLTVRDAKWIYAHCPNGTVVQVVTAGGPAVTCVASIPKLPAGAAYDPTDTSISH